MLCPHCRGRVPMTWEALRRRRRAKGACVDCGKPAGVCAKTGATYWRCQTCRDAAQAHRVTALNKAEAPYPDGVS